MMRVFSLFEFSALLDQLWDPVMRYWFPVFTSPSMTAYLWWRSPDPPLRWMSMPDVARWVYCVPMSVLLSMTMRTFFPAFFRAICVSAISVRVKVRIDEEREFCARAIVWQRRFVVWSEGLKNDWTGMPLMTKLCGVLSAFRAPKREM